MKVLRFEGERRDGVGKGSARKERRGGYIPGVLYGPGAEPAAVRIDRKGAEKIVRRLESHNVIADLALVSDGGPETIKTIVKEIQFEPVSGEILHMDFYRMRMDQAVEMEVAIHLVGESAGVKQGGIIEHELREIAVSAFPVDIPERIDVDVSALEIGQVLTVKDIVAPERVRLVEEPDRIVVSVQAPRKVEEEEKPAEEVAAAATATEPEVISAEKTEERRKAKEESKDEAKKESARKE